MIAKIEIGFGGNEQDGRTMGAHRRRYDRCRNFVHTEDAKRIGVALRKFGSGRNRDPTATDTVKVQYTGKLINGTVFDSSAQRGPLEIQLGKVIPGWTEGLQKINQGGKIRLYIPPKLAYGDRGEQGIPPGATLIFDVELLDTKATPPAEVAPALPPPVPPKN